MFALKPNQHFHRSRKHLNYNIAIVQNNTNLKLILQVPVPHQTRHTSYQIIDLHTPTTAQPWQRRLWEKTNSIRLCFASRRNKFCWNKQVQDKQRLRQAKLNQHQCKMRIRLYADSKWQRFQLKLSCFCLRLLFSLGRAKWPLAFARGSSWKSSWRLKMPSRGRAINFIKIA